jgi:hypothetical protein
MYDKANYMAYALDRLRDLAGLECEDDASPEAGGDDDVENAERLEGSYAELKAARDRLRAEVSSRKSPYPPARTSASVT